MFSRYGKDGRRGSGGGSELSGLERTSARGPWLSARATHAEDGTRIYGTGPEFGPTEKPPISFADRIERIERAHARRDAIAAGDVVELPTGATKGGPATPDEGM